MWCVVQDRGTEVFELCTAQLPELGGKVVLKVTARSAARRHASMYQTLLATSIVPYNPYPQPFVRIQPIPTTLCAATADQTFGFYRLPTVHLLCTRQPPLLPPTHPLPRPTSTMPTMPGVLQEEW
jgi:hypothetical protein